jgi:RNA polymerase sigma-70 factor (ECF subfamily)
MESRNGEVPSPLQVVTNINEATLLATARSGEAAALDTLYRAHAEKLFRTVHRITRNREDAEDAVQDSFLRAFLHLKSFDGRSTFSTWLTRIGINSALMILRKKRNSSEMSAHRAGVDEALWEVPDSAPNPEIRCAERERERFLREAIAGLRPRLRRTLEFHTLEDHSLRETAAQIDSAADANGLTGADDGTIQHVSREREGRKSHDGRGDIEYPHGHFQSRTEGAGLRCS